MHIESYFPLRSGTLQGANGRCNWHRAFSALLLLALLCSLSPSTTQAQEEAPAWCAALSDDDCALLTEAHAQMRLLRAVTAESRLNISAGNIPNAPFDSLSFALDQRVTQVLSTEAADALEEMRQITQREPRSLRQAPQQLLALYAAVLTGTNFASSLQLSISDDVVRLIEQTAAEEGEPIPFPLSSRLSFNVRLVDGTLFVNVSDLAALLPGLTATGEIWFGLEFAPVLDQLFQAALADANPDSMSSTDAELFAQMLAASASNTGGPLAATIAALPFGEPVLAFLQIARVEDGDVDGRATARFRTTVDYAELLADPLVQELIAELIRNPDFGAQDMDELEMAQMLAVVQQFGPMVLETLGLEFIEQIELETGLFLGGELTLNWDASQLAPLLAVAGIPDLDEAQQLPVIALNASSSYRDHNAALQVERPETALIIATSELLKLIPPEELDFLSSEPSLPPLVASDEAVAADALALLANGNALEAVSLFDEAIRLNPNNAEYYTERGRSHYLLGNYAEALADAERAIELEPNARRYNLRGAANEALGNIDASFADYERAIGADPGFPLAYFNRGLLYTGLGEDELAIADFDAAVAADPDYADAYYQRGAAHYRLNDFDAAVADYSTVLEIDPQYGRVFAARAAAHSELGNYELALADYDAAIAFDDGDAHTYLQRGLVYYNLDQLEEEIADYTAALELDPSYATAHHYRALSYQDLGDYQLALDDYDRALTLEPDNADILIDRGLLYLDLDENELALADFDRAIELTPDDATGHINRSHVQSLLGNYEESLTSASQAVELAPDDPIAWGNRADAYGKIGNFEQALADFEQALKLDSDYATAYLDRGKLHHELGRVEDAIADLAYYLELSPEAADREEVEALLEELRVDANVTRNSVSAAAAAASAAAIAANVARSNVQDGPGEDASTASADRLLRMLRMVPDLPEYRRYITFGDAAAWHAATGVPRIEEPDELDSLSEDERNAMLFTMNRETIFPSALGTQYIAAEDQRGHFGFNIFTLDRWLEAGNLPQTINVVEFSTDAAAIAEALTAAGYSSTSLDDGSTLYRVRDDFEIQTDAPLRTGMMGELNRIVLNDGQMIIGRATEIVENAQAAATGTQPSLADVPAFGAAARALADLSLSELGELVGVLFVSDAAGDPLTTLGPNATAEQARAVRGALGEASLPPVVLPAFATHRRADAAFLTLAAVFPPGTDIEQATQILAERMRTYTSLVTGKPLNERWELVQSIPLTIEGMPLALVTMRIRDSASPLSWSQLVVARDLAFLWSD